MRFSLNKLRILQKGLLIAFLPLFLNGGLVLILNQSLNSTAAAMEMSRINSLWITHLSRSMLCTIGILTMGTNAVINGTFTVFNERVSGLMQDLLTTMAQINTLAPQDTDAGRLTAQITDLVNRQRALFTKATDRSVRYENTIIKARRARDWTHTSIKESQLLQKELLAREAIFKEAAAGQKLAQTKTLTIVAVGILINFLLSCLLVFFFHRNITSRLAGLIKNARHLARHEPMVEKTGGADELTTVARALHTVNRDLETSREYRRSLMQMMAHDLRSPLMAANVALNILEKEENNSASDGELTHIRNELEGCLELIGDLLLLENFESSIKLDLELENIYELIGTALENAPAISEKVKISNRSEAIYLRCDREKILVLIKKLAETAVDRAEAGTTLIIEGARAGEQLSVSMAVQAAEQTAAHATERQQLKAKLSSALCKKIVAAHGGKLLPVLEQTEQLNYSFSLPLNARGFEEEKT